MDALKKLFPYSFTKKKSLGDLIVNIIVYLLAGIVGAALIGLLGGIPVIGAALKIVGWLIDLYVLVGIILSVLHYMKAIK